MLPRFLYAGALTVLAGYLLKIAQDTHSIPVTFLSLIIGVVAVANLIEMLGEYL